MEEETKVLIARFKQGDTGSFKRLAGLYANRVSSIIYYILGETPSEAEDLAQEVFIKVYRNLNSFREMSKFSTWLYRITVNTVWDYLRKQKRRKTISLEEIEDEGQSAVGASPETVRKELQQKELAEKLKILIQRLPYKYRTVIVLKDIENLSYKDIAKVSRCSIGTVESRLFRARMMLKDKAQKTPWAREITNGEKYL